MRTSPASPFWATSHRDQAQTPYSLISGWPFLHLEENDLSFPKGAPSRLEGLAPESAQLMLGARRGSSGVKTDSGRKWKKSGRPHQLDQEATLEPHTEHQVWSCSVFQRTPRQREEKKFKVKVRGAGGLEFTLIKGHLKTHCNPDKPWILGRSLLSSHVVQRWVRKRQSHRQGMGQWVPGASWGENVLQSAVCPWTHALEAGERCPKERHLLCV